MGIQILNVIFCFNEKKVYVNGIEDENSFAFGQNDKNTNKTKPTDIFSLQSQIGFSNTVVKR